MANIIPTEAVDDILDASEWNIESTNIWDHWVMPDSPPRKTQVEVLDMH